MSRCRLFRSSWFTTSAATVSETIANAFEKGHLGVMDFYNIKNVQSDTSMRNNIASMTGGSDSGPGRN